MRNPGCRSRATSIMAVTLLCAFFAAPARADDPDERILGRWTRDGSGDQPLLIFGDPIGGRGQRYQGKFGLTYPIVSPDRPNSVQYGDGKFTSCDTNGADMCFEAPTLRCF